MTKKLEAFFNLPPTADLEEIIEPEVVEPTKTRTELLADAQEIYSALTTAEKVDMALPTVRDLEIHNTEMDDISKKAIKTFEDLIDLGNNVPDMHAGKIYEVAGQMLKTALDAKNSKADKKLKMIELQLKKIRVEQIDRDAGKGPLGPSQGTEFDRNELLKYFVDAKKIENSDK